MSRRNDCLQISLFAILRKNYDPNFVYGYYDSPFEGLMFLRIVMRVIQKKIMKIFWYCCQKSSIVQVTEMRKLKTSCFGRNSCFDFEKVMFSKKREKICDMHKIICILLFSTLVFLDYGVIASC